MARRKRWFLSRLSNEISPAEARAFLKSLGLEPKAVETILARFWGGQPMKYLDMPRSEQLRLLPLWDKWAEDRWRTVAVP